MGDDTEQIEHARRAEEIGRTIRRQWPRETTLDKQRLQADGVRCLDGKHIVLYTDLPSEERFDELPGLFDQMIPLLCDYFGLEQKNYEDFRIEAFLIRDFDKFKTGGAVRQVQKLRNGYALRHRIWLRDQTSDYYRRHLLLHEGVHAFMGHAFGYWGPPWYREGTAELLGTHCWKNGKLRLAIFPDDPKAFDRWGRIEYIRAELKQDNFCTIDNLFKLGPEDYNANESYAWSWAFAAFCEHHSRYRNAFRQTAWFLSGEDYETKENFLNLLTQHGAEQTQEDLTRGPLTRLEVQSILENDWFDFQRNICYGYNFKATEIEFAKDVFEPSSGILSDGKAKNISVLADRGWQNSGLTLQRGKTYTITAAGRYQLGNDPAPWISEPNGITLRYHGGKPLGILLAAIVGVPEQTNGNGQDDQNDNADGDFLHPKVVGLRTVWTPNRSGMLFFRINDFPSELDDNQGEATVMVE